MRTLLAILPVFSQLMVPLLASAQERAPWTATVSMTRKVLAVGECSAVSLVLKSANGESPRGPNGQLVSMADFDLSAGGSSERSVVGKYDGANYFAVCACPKALVGTVATVTATYPSKWIAPKVRIPGVAFTTTTSAPIVGGSSSGNPPGCDASGTSTSGAWLITVQPSVSALVIGGCSAVSLTIRDSTGKDTPRNPLGGRISLTDFDMSATTANGADVVGKYDGASWFAACACQTGTVGEAATITARYPAEHLDAKARVPGVEMQVTAPLTLAPARGSSNPKGCGDTQVAQAVPADVAPGAAAPVDGSKIVRRRDPPASTPPATPTIRVAPPALEGPIAVALGTGKGTLMPKAGAPPTNVTLNASPRVARFSWTAAPNAVRYALWRGNGPGVSAERTPPAFTATQFVDTVPDAHETYRYTVVAYYADGTHGEAPAVQFTSPTMTNPAGFTAVASGVTGGGGVTFQWQAVPGAARYRIDGPGLPATGYFAIGTSAAHPHMPAGQDEFRLQTMYPGNFGDSASASTATALVHVLPSHSIPWLSHRNGSGSLAQVQTPAHQEVNDVVGGNAFGTWSGDLIPVYDQSYATWLGQTLKWDGYWKLIPEPIPTCKELYDDERTYCGFRGLKIWFNLTATNLWDDSTQDVKEAVYGNPTDLGVGRRTYCFQSDSVGYRGYNAPATLGPRTVCYATAHGITPGHPGFNDPQTITHPIPGVGSDFILAMVIVKDPSGTVFLALGKNGTYPLLPAVNLDTEGPKFLPFACISCHGGTYNTTTRKVDGSSFLPLDPNLLSFASAADKAAQEEKIRVINAMIKKAQPQSAIAQYLNGLYHGAIGTAGTTAVPDYVPASWAPQAGFYRQVVRANCTMCHLAAPDSWNFASWQNFQDNAGLIYADVCLQHTMPHAEVPFKNFWLKDTGILYIPGLLAATLGKPSC